MDESPTRATVLAAIDGGQAYMTFDAAVADFPAGHVNTRPHHVPYTFWHLLEHIRVTARDILDYVDAEEYREREWPREYWPDPAATADAAAWTSTLDGIRADLARLRAIVANPATDLHAPVRHSGGNARHTLLREVLVVLEHNAYHTGEFAILRQIEGLWPEGHA